MTSESRHQLWWLIPWVIVAVIMWWSANEHRTNQRRNVIVFDDRETWMLGITEASELIRDDRFTMTNFHEFVAANPHLEIVVPEFTPLSVEIPEVPRRDRH